MKKFLLGLGVVLLGAFVYVSQPWVNAATNGVTIYENENYSGYSAVLTVGEYPLTALKALGVKNNDISSIRVPAGYKAELFDRDKIKGDPFVFTTDDPSFKDNGCDNMVSAVRVTYSG
ncbi:MAG TPA: hypothetical protein VEC37_05155, partial [Bacillota bacterium]|nr:hypothetical protein [Bacillota bacterium]